MVITSVQPVRTMYQKNLTVYLFSCLSCGLKFGRNHVGKKRKKDFLWSQMYDLDLDEETLIEQLKRYWIPLLEQALNQARRLLEKLERDR